MKGLVLPEQPGSLIVASDGDEAGAEAAEALADRADALGWSVEHARGPGRVSTGTTSFRKGRQHEPASNPFPSSRHGRSPTSAIFATNCPPPRRFRWRSSAPRWAAWIRGAAEAKAAPPDYVVAALLSVFGSLIGNSPLGVAVAGLGRAADHLVDGDRHAVDEQVAGPRRRADARSATSSGGCGPRLSRLNRFGRRRPRSPSWPSRPGGRRSRPRSRTARTPLRSPRQRIPATSR